MPNFGSTSISDIFFGNQEIVEAYFGSTKIWSKNTGPQYVKYVYTIRNSGPEVNGNYWDTGEILNGAPVYTNGQVYLSKYGSNW